MSDYSSIPPSSGPPRSPLFGTATFSTLSATQTPMSPSRLSSTVRSTTPITSSYDSDDASSGRQMRRIVVSPSPTSRESDSYTYSEEDSMQDAAEVEAELAQINDDIDDFLSEVSRGSSRGPSTYTSYTGPSTYTSYTGPSTYSSRTDSVSNTGSGTSTNLRSTVGAVPLLGPGARLSTISEHTENTPSRPSSYPSAGDANRLSAHIEGTVSHTRAATEPSQAAQPPRPLPSTPGPRVGERIAFFEDRTAASSGSPAPIYGHSRTGSAPSAIRSPSPYTSTQSRSMPTLTSTGYGYSSTTGYGTTTYGSRPSSRTGSAASYSGPNTTMSSMLSPPPRTHSALSWDSRNVTSTAGTTLTSRTPVSSNTYTASGTDTATYTNPSSNTLSSLNATTMTPTSTTLTPRQMSPSDRTALSQVRNVINRWKERTPSMGKSERSATSPSPTQSDGLFSIRRRASRGSARLRDRALQAANRSGGRRASDPPSATGLEESGSGSLSTSGLLPPPFDISEMGQYTGGPEAQEPLRIGLLWYLNVHAAPPYRWQRCQALLYPHMLLLSWIAPGGGRGIVTLDLLNCTEVVSAKSPMHHAARDDVGTLAAIMQSQNAASGVEAQLGEAELMQTLSPFHLHYTDGIERLGTDSPRERVRWVSAIWDVLDRAVSIPDRSASGSPTGSVRTMRSFASSGSSRSGTASGSASTRYVPHIDTIPDISDLQSISSSGTRTGLSRGPSLASAHRTRATDDSAVSNQAFLYPGDPRVIAPSRSSSIRRTSSLTDLDEEFASAVRRARDSRPGLGFGLGLAGGIPVGDGSPVTVSSGPRLGREVYMSPPPSVGRGSERARSRASDSATTVSDDAFFSGRSRTASSFYSSSSFTRGLTTTDTRTGTGLGTDDTLLDIVSGTGTNIVASTLSLRGTTSASMLGDSHSGLPSTSPSRSGLTRSRAVTRRTPRSSSRSYTSYDRSSEDTSDKENTSSCTPTATRSYTEGLSTLESYSSSYTPTRSYTPTPSSTSYTRSTDETSRSADEPDSELARSSTTAYSTDYVTAKSPSELSYVSLPTIPSLPSDYETADVCSTEYETAPKCLTEPLSEYETAEVCSTEPGSDYITAEVCPSEAETDYKTAECRCTKKAEEAEEDVVSVSAPSAIPTIPSASPRSVVEELRPEDIPLPPSVYSPSVTPSLPSEEVLSLVEEPVPSPSPLVLSEEESSVMSIPGPSPIPTTESPLGSLPSVSTVSTPTESSITPTPTDLLTPTVPSTIEQPPTPSSPGIPESLWGVETDGSYESSLLRASPSVQSLALPEGADTSFETSFLRPSGSPYTEEDAVTLLTPITEVSTESATSVPSSPSESITPTPSTISLPPSVPSPTPISTEVPVPTVTLSRTPSSVSTISSISMSSSVFEPRSLFEYPMSVSEDDISTEPSLLSVVPSPTIRAVSPQAVPLPPSPGLTLEPPTPTMSVSITTPRGDIPSIMSALETVPSEAPSTILTHDVNRLLQYLNDIDTQRGAENREMARNIEEIRHLLEELRDSQRDIPMSFPVPAPPPVPLQQQPLPPPPPQPQPQSPSVVTVREIIREIPYPVASRAPDAPPPVPRKDRSVGGSSIISRSPMGPRESLQATPRPTPPRLIPIPLTPPPIRIPSPDTISETMSFLSSHHSDDLSLMESESYPAIPTSPSWPSDSSPSPESSPESEPLSLRSVSSALSASPTPPPSSSTPASPTPSTESSGTVRQIPPVDLNSLRVALAQIREEMTALQSSQANASHILEELRSRPVGQDVSECCRRLEEAIQRILEQTQRPPPQAPARDDRSESLYPSGSDTSLLDHIARLRDEVGRDVPPIQMPVPVRAGPSFDERLVDMLAEGPAVTQQPIQPPPPIIPLTYRPGPRVSRPRSASPVFETDLPPRPGTFPVAYEPVNFERRERRPVPRTRRPRPFIPTEPSESESAYAQNVPHDRRRPTPRGPEDDIDFLREVQNRRRGRHPQAQDGFYGPRQPEAPEADRPGTAPAFVHVPPMPAQPAPGQTGPVPAPPPGVFAPVPPTQTVLQIPFDDILTLLRDNRTAQLASIDQIREVMRYLRDFNDWHGRDVEDRHAEIRGLNARIDQIRDMIYDLMGRREPYSTPGEAPAPQPQPQPIPVPGVVIPPMPQQLYPPGFVPQPRPGFPDAPVIPDIRDESTPTPDYRPVIPSTPPHTGIFIPPGMPPQPAPVVIQPHGVYTPHDQYEDRPVIPPSPPPESRSGTGSSETRSPEAGSYDDVSEATAPLIIPPHGLQGPAQERPIQVPPPPVPGPITIYPAPPDMRAHEELGSRAGSPTGTEQRYAEPRPGSSRARSRSRSPSPRIIRTGPPDLHPGSPRHPSAPRSEVASPPPMAATPHPPIIIQPAGPQPYIPGQAVPMMPGPPPMQPPIPQVIPITDPTMHTTSPRTDYSDYPRHEEPVRSERRSPSPESDHSDRRVPTPGPTTVVVHPTGPQPQVVMPGATQGVPPVIVRAPQEGPSEHPAEIIVRTEPSRRTPSPSRRYDDRDRDPDRDRDRDRYRPTRSRDRSPDYGRGRAYMRSPGGRRYYRSPDDFSRRGRDSRDPYTRRRHDSRDDPYRRGRPYHEELSRSPEGYQGSRRYGTQRSSPPGDWDDPRRLGDYAGPSTRSRRDSRSPGPYDRRQRARGRQLSRSPSPLIVQIRSPEPGLQTRSRSPTLVSQPYPGRVSSSRRRQRISRSPDEGEGSPTPTYVPHRPPRPTRRPEHDDYDGTRRMSPSPDRYSPPLDHGAHVHVRTPSQPPELPRSPTVVDFGPHQPPGVSPDVVRVRSGRTPSGPVPSGRGPSQVTMAPEFEEATPIEAGHVLSRSPSNVSALHQAYAGADAPTPAAISRAGTGRSRRTDPVQRDYEPTEESIPLPVPAPHDAALTEHDYAEEPGEGYHPPEWSAPVTPSYEAPSRRPTVRDDHAAPSVHPSAVPSRRPTLRDDHAAPSVHPSAAPSRRPTLRDPTTDVGQYRESGPGALNLEDLEREQNERFGELERQVTETLGSLQDAEAARDQAFRGNEDERQRIFEDHENRRDQETAERRDAVWRELEDRLANLVQQVPLPVPPPPEPGVTDEEPPSSDVVVDAPVVQPTDARAYAESIRTVAQDAASRHAQEILETVRLEREELMRERELAQAERERQQAELEAARQRLDEDREARIRALEEELASVRAELENERQLRLTEESERRDRERIEMLERDEAMRQQLEQLTDLVSQQREQLERKQELSEQHWAEKQQWMEQCNNSNTELRQLVQQVIEERAEDRAACDADREARANDPSIQNVLDEMAAFRREQDELLRQMAETWRADCARQHEDTLNAVRSTAHEQIPFNVQGYLDEFSRSLAAEVRMLLGEVGRLREERRNIQYELGCLLTMKAKMGPGGEFDPEWRPPTGPCARDAQAAPPPSEAPPEAPPPEEPPQPARPAWRSVMQRGSRRSRRSQAAPPPPPEPAPEVRPPVESWATWQPNPTFVPTPPPNPPTTLLVPQQSSPGLFGPRSPRSSNSIHP